MHLHAGSAQRCLEGRRIGVRAQGEQHVRDSARRARAGNGLVGTLAARVGLEGVAKYCLPGRRDVRRLHNKVEIGRTGNKNHG